MKYKEINSSSNPTFKELKALLKSDGILESGNCLLSGKDLIQEVLDSKLNNLIEAEISNSEDFHSNCSKKFKLDPGLFKELDSLGTHHNLLVIKAPEIKKTETFIHPGFTVVLPLQDPSNLGAALRSCEAFGVHQVVLTKECAHPFLPKSLKAASGSALRMKIMKGPSLSEIPEEAFVLDQGGIELSKVIWPKDTCLVIGEEGQGTKKIRAGQKISIPTQKVESLNATVALSIALYARKSQK